MTDKEDFAQKERRERKRAVVFLALALAVSWLLFDVIFIRQETYGKAEEFSFENKTDIQVREKIKQEIRRYQSSMKPYDQVCALVHALECNYYLLYNRRRGMSRYYDFLKVVLFPSLRGQLKSKENYVRQARRYMKRKRNLSLLFDRYEISVPKFSNCDEEENHDVAEILVQRTMKSENSKTGELFKYYLRRHSDNRFYLYFEDGSAITRYTPMTETAQRKESK